MIKPLFDPNLRARIDTEPRVNPAIEPDTPPAAEAPRPKPAFRDTMAEFARDAARELRPRLLNWTFGTFAAVVLLPVAAASVYYAFIASNQYVAEFRFTVKDASPRGASAGNSLMSLFGGISGTNNFDNYLVIDYLMSRQAVDQLAQRIDITKLYSGDSIDWLSRYNAGKPVEAFVSYWKGKITARYDQITGLAIAEVRAFTPEDALLISKTLVSLSEELVNAIANRSQVDAVRFAEREVKRAEDRLKETRTKLTAYRNRMGLIDPVTSVAASNSALIQSLRSNLAAMETQLATLMRQNLEPSSPAISVLNNQIRSTRDQLQKVEGTVGQDRDGVALSTIMAEFEQLDMERQFAQTLLTGAVQALDAARVSAASQHLYITPYVRPSLPESTTYPKRLTSVFLVGLFAFFVWVAGLLVVRSIRERFS